MVLDFNQIKKVKVETQPYSFFCVENTIVSDKLIDIENEFPVIQTHGIFNCENFNLGPVMKELISEFSSDLFRSIIEEKFDIDLTNKELLFNFRSVMRKQDGQIHTDNSDKIVTILLYFNKGWITHKLPRSSHLKDSGCLRILNSATDINDYVKQVPPILGNMVAFKVSNNSYHGHLSHDCTRKTLQFNYWN